MTEMYIKLYSMGPPGIDNGVHGTEKLLLNIQKSEDLHSEVNLQIQYSIYVMDIFKKTSLCGITILC